MPNVGEAVWHRPNDSVPWQPARIKAVRAEKVDLTVYDRASVYEIRDVDYRAAEDPSITGRYCHAPAADEAAVLEEFAPA